MSEFKTEPVMLSPILTFAVFSYGIMAAALDVMVDN
jgi:hypothetical protein